MRKLHNLILIAASATISLGIMEVKPSTAASFEFLFKLGGYDSTGSGFLNFEGSPLQGIGTETAKLSELEAADFSYYVSGGDIFIDSYFGSIIYGTWINDPIFTFNSGKLIGLNLNSYSESVSNGDSEGSVSLSIRGNRFLELFEGTVTITDEGQRICNIDSYYDESTGEYYEYETDCYYELVTYTEYISTAFADGTIEFTTIEPVEAIPEPLTILGTATVLGFGTLFKRKTR